MDNGQQMEVLCNRVKKALEDSLPVIVVGWKASNHDDFTRSLPKKKVLFLGSDLNPIRNKRSGFVIRAPFLDHKMSDVISSNGSLKLNPGIIEIGKIKNALKKHQSLIFTDEYSTCAPGESCCSDEQSETNSLDTLGANLTTPEIEMDEYDRLATEFDRASKGSENGLVSIFHFGQIRVDSGVTDTNPTLIKREWVIPVTLEGKSSAGWYKAGPLLLERLQDERLEPSDPIEKAQFLIGMGDRFQNELKDIQTEMKAKMDEIEEKYAEKIERARRKIERMEQAKELIKKLEDI